MLMTVALVSVATGCTITTNTNKTNNPDTNAKMEIGCKWKQGPDGSPIKDCPDTVTGGTAVQAYASIRNGESQERTQIAIAESQERVRIAEAEQVSKAYDRQQQTRGQQRQAELETLEALFPEDTSSGNSKTTTFTNQIKKDAKGNGN